MIERDRILTAALLWLRNHYDVGDRRQAAKVLAVVDRVLDDGTPLSRLDERVFKATYPAVEPAKDCMRSKA